MGPRNSDSFLGSASGIDDGEDSIALRDRRRRFVRFLEQLLLHPSHCGRRRVAPPRPAFAKVELERDRERRMGRAIPAQ